VLLNSKPFNKTTSMKNLFHVQDGHEMGSITDAPLSLLLSRLCQCGEMDQSALDGRVRGFTWKLGPRLGRCKLADLIEMQCYRINERILGTLSTCIGCWQRTREQRKCDSCGKRSTLMNRMIAFEHPSPLLQRVKMRRW